MAVRVPPGSQKVFEQVLVGVEQSGAPGFFFASAPSDPRFNDWLGRANDLRLFVVVDRVSTQLDQLTVYVQDTPDEETAWNTLTTGASQSFVPANVTTILTGADTDAGRGRPGLGIRRIIVVGQNEGASFSARVRVWVSGRNGYRKFHRLLVSERLEGTAPMYGPHDACAWLVGVDNIAIVGFAEEISGLNSSLVFLVGESSNGRIWRDTSNSIPIVSGTTQLLVVGGAIFGFPWSGFARFGLQLGGVNVAATVRLWVTGRDIRSG